MQIRKVCDMHKPEGQTQISKPFFLNQSYESPFLPSALLKTPTLDKIDQDLIFTSSCSRHFSGHSHNTTQHIFLLCFFHIFHFGSSPFSVDTPKDLPSKAANAASCQNKPRQKTGRQSKSHRQKVSIATILNASLWAYVPSINVTYIFWQDQYMLYKL